MQIDITQIINAIDDEGYVFIGSVANYGEGIARRSFNNCLEYIDRENPFTISIELLVKYFNEYGAWEDLVDWSEKELHALLIQLIAGDYEEYKYAIEIVKNRYDDPDKIELSDFDDEDLALMESYSSGTLYMHDNRFFYLLDI